MLVATGTVSEGFFVLFLFLPPLQWDLVCASRALKDLAQFLYMAGVLFGGIVFGGLSDR